MGVMDFVKDAGASIGIGESKAEQKAAAARADAQKKMAAARREAQVKAKAAAASRKKATDAKKKADAAAQREAAMSAVKGEKLEKYVTGLGLKAKGLDIKFDSGTVTVRGTASNKATSEKIALALGNTEGVRRVDNKLKVAPAPKRKAPAAASKLTPAQRRAATARRKAASSAQIMHTVKSGDTLGKLAKKYLGDAGRYPEIFKANQPMLTNPDMIQVGQTLRIPKK